MNNYVERLVIKQINGRNEHDLDHDRDCHCEKYWCSFDKKIFFAARITQNVHAITVSSLFLTIRICTSTLQPVWQTFLLWCLDS